jgi:hypothetical protein
MLDEDVQARAHLGSRRELKGDTFVRSRRRPITLRLQGHKTRQENERLET